MLEPNPGIIAHYRNSYSAVVKAAVQPNVLTEQLLRARRDAGVAWARNVNGRHHATLIAALRQAKLPPLRTSELRGVRGRIAPLPVVPDLFHRPLPQMAHHYLRDLFRATSWNRRITEIMERSVFQTGDLRYRTDWKDGKLCLFGESNFTLASLAFLAHELGHCLAETKHGGETFRAKIISEAYAQALEEKVVDHVLAGSPTDRREWYRYQRVIDKLNFYFYFSELADAGIAVPGFALQALDPALLLLRETLFTSAGYQEIYAQASLLRLKALGHLVEEGSSGDWTAQSITVSS